MCKDEQVQTCLYIVFPSLMPRISNSFISAGSILSLCLKGAKLQHWREDSIGSSYVRTKIQFEDVNDMLRSTILMFSSSELFAGIKMRKQSGSEQHIVFVRFLKECTVAETVTTIGWSEISRLYCSRQVISNGRHARWFDIHSARFLRGNVPLK